MFRFGMAFAALFLCVPGLAAQRRVEYLLRSDSLPRTAVSVSAEFQYLGSLDFEVGTVAEASEYVFGDTANGVLRRAFIAHFEHFRPDNTKTFQYPRLDMVLLGSHEYLHQTWALEEFALFSLPPMQQFLRARGLRADGRWLVDRYLRVVDSGSKYEVIFFYLESETLHPSGIRFGGGQSDTLPPPAPPPAVVTSLLRRAHSAFTVSDP